jgi:hypothetical protein
MKPGQIRPLYLEPRLHKQSVKQEINNHGTCLAKPLHTKQTKNVWRTIGTSNYNGRICPGFINSKFGKQSYPQSFCNIGGIRGIPLKNIAYNLVIADSYQI